MKVREKKKIKVEKKFIKEAYCDFCNAKFDKELIEYEGFGQLNISFGYGSSFDGDDFDLDICDNCFIKLFKDKLKEQFIQKGFDLNHKMFKIK